LVLVLVVHRGRLFSGEGGGGRRETFRVAGVGVMAVSFLLGDVAENVGLGMADFRAEAACGSPEYRRTLDIVVRVAELPTELPRLLEGFSGVVEPLRPFPGVMITDEAGELPGVSTTLLARGLSIVTMVDIESRKC
jgi:hypothetical protein